MKNPMTGYSLIELLSVISILVILSFGALAVLQTVEDTQRNTSLKSLYQIIQYARLMSIEQGITTTLCGTADGINCLKNWYGAKIILFFDKNNNKRLDNGEPLYREKALTATKIAWRGSNRAYMRFHPEGYLMDWGSYTFCPQSPSQDSIKLVFNRLGRGYKTAISATTIKQKGLCEF